MFSKNRFAQRSQSFKSLSPYEFSELAPQKESSKSTAFSASSVNSVYQASRAQMAPPEVLLSATTS